MCLPDVIWPEFRMGQYRDDNHQEDAPHFIKMKRNVRTIWKKLDLIDFIQSLRRTADYIKAFALNQTKS